MPEKFRAKQHDVSLQPSLWIDIDLQGGLHSGENYLESIENAISFLPFQPSVIVDSGYGIHAYYCFSKMLVLDEHNRAEAELRNKKLISIVRHNTGVYDTSVDSVQDLSRIMRIHGTFNYKLGFDKPTLCRVIQSSQTFYNIDEFDYLIENSIKNIPVEPECHSKNLKLPSTKHILATPNIFDCNNLSGKTVTCEELIRLIRASPFEKFFRNVTGLAVGFVRNMAVVVELMEPEYHNIKISIIIVDIAVNTAILLIGLNTSTI